MLLLQSSMLMGRHVVEAWPGRFLCHISTTTHGSSTFCRVPLVQEPLSISCLPRKGLSNRSTTGRFLSRHTAEEGIQTSKSTSPIDKETGYSKLPRLYVGEIQPEMTRLSSISELFTLQGQKRSPDSQQKIVCHENAILSLSHDQSHYLTSVLRLGKKRKAAAQVRVFDGTGSEWLARVMDANQENGRRSRHKKSGAVTVQCLHELKSSSTDGAANVHLQQPLTQSDSSVWLCLAPPKKKDRLRWLVEKTVELGVNGFFFIDSEFGEALDKSSYSYAKLHAYAMEAAEQCERMDLPHFLAVGEGGNEEGTFSPVDSKKALMEKQATHGVDMVCLSEFLDLLATQSDSRVHLLVCRERSDSLHIWNALEGIFSYTSPGESRKEAVLLMVGPEGGWSPNEEELMDALERKHPALIRNISLGPTILRAETAAMTAVVAFNLYRDSSHVSR